MARKTIPPQFTRLALLTVVIVVAYFTARSVLTPRSFGQFGWYRADAIEELRQKEPVFAGRLACNECHKEAVQKLAKAEHKDVSCESCHGVSQGHVENPDVRLPKLTDAHCVRCHERAPARPAWLKQMDPAKHYNAQRCAECHVPHQPTEVP
jgi:hypothetical protein